MKPSAGEKPRGRRAWLQALGSQVGSCYAPSVDYDTAPSTLHYQVTRSPGQRMRIATPCTGVHVNDSAL